ncbi:alpha-ketoglutarate dehydrogenase component 4 isoform X2 [Anabrus simplex]|uniref:alpha-ketoglutarate dehydrogenase component 4 isoform X2 n=1 Tax=Anabrus simplex TaxID=316456 RepID=UPI0035A3B5E2
MAGLAIARAWQTIKPHVPLIKFRKGGLAVDDARVSGAVSHAPAPPSGSGAAPQPAARVTSGVVLEDYQLPPRYQRKLLDEKEIEYINRGGPE